MGLPIPEPDEAVYTEAELETARMTHVARDAGISDEDLLELLRVLGRGLSQAAESLRTLPLKLVLEPGMSESELAHRYAESVARALSDGRPACQQPARAAPAPLDAEHGRQRVGADRRAPARLARGRGVLCRPGRFHAPRRGSPAR